MEDSTSYLLEYQSFPHAKYCVRKCCRELSWRTECAKLIKIVFPSFYNFKFVFSHYFFTFTNKFYSLFLLICLLCVSTFTCVLLGLESASQITPPKTKNIPVNIKMLVMHTILKVISILFHIYTAKNLAEVPCE